MAGLTRRVRWSVIGVGRAGRARARAILEDPRCKLAGVFRGRHAASLETRVFDSLEQAIGSADVVAICSPTELHVEHATQVLEAGRHAVVEFPLAPTAAEARALFALARDAGRVLHVEHIELLDGPSTTLGALVRPAFVRRIEVAFEGPGDPDAPPGRLALDSVARLHRMVHVGGPIEAVERIDSAPGRLAAGFLLASGARAELSVQRDPYFRRRTVLEVEEASGTWRQENGTLARNGRPVTLMEVRSLFGRDHAEVMRILKGEAESYLSEARIAAVLGVVEALSYGRLGPVSG